MKIIIKEVQSKKELLQFIKLPLKLYKRSSYYVPPMIADELKTLSVDRNPAFEFCESKYWLAYKNNMLVGRIAGIINHKYNEKTNRISARFGWLDFNDDQEIVDALFKTRRQRKGAKPVEQARNPATQTVPLLYQGIIKEMKYGIVHHLTPCKAIYGLNERKR